MRHVRFVAVAAVALRRTATLALVALLMVVPLWAAEGTTELAKKTQNPVADLISIPLQNNFNFGLGPNNVTQYVGNIQPVNTQRSAYYNLKQPQGAADWSLRFQIQLLLAT
jgi:hypothetical protein